MKNFDESRNSRPRRTEEERTFVLAGQTFVIRDRFRPDVLVPIESLEDTIFDFTTCKCGHRLYEHADAQGNMQACSALGCKCQKMDEKVVSPGSSLQDQLTAVDTTIIGMLEDRDGFHERYTAVRANEDDAIEVEDMMDIIKWATEKDTDRPTGPPSVSSAGPVATGTPSTDGSSQPETQAA